ncbi:MAG: mechanosensitive ion channel domain-containing protein [Halobacteriaceae archaeon]
MVTLETVLDALQTEQRFLLALVVLLGGLVLGVFVGRVNRRLLDALGVDDAVEGTSFERTAQSFGTSTISVFARLSAWFIYGLAVVAALQVARLLNTQVFWLRATGLIPNLIVAAAVFAAGIVIGDKAELTVSERLKGIKLPEIGLLPKLVKYSIVYVAALVAASQIGVATGALVVLLAGYVFGVLLLAGLALQDVLRSATAGVYLLLREPYGIGDRVEFGDHIGIVQEVTMLVTRVESDEREYVVPNHRALEHGVTIVHE